MSQDQRRRQIIGYPDIQEISLSLYFDVKIRGRLQLIIAMDTSYQFSVRRINQGRGNKLSVY